MPRKRATTNVNDQLSEPGLLNKIILEVATGGSLVEFCRQHAMSYRAVLSWIQDDDDMAEKYQRALEIRSEHAKDEIIKEMFALLRADVTEAFDDNGNMRLVRDMPPELRRLIGGYEYNEVFEQQSVPGERGKQRVHVGNLHKVKFWDRPKSIETFMRHLRMLDTRSEIGVDASLAQLLMTHTGDKDDKAKRSDDQDKGARAPRAGKARRP